MLVERVAVPDAPAFEPVETWPGLADMAKLQKLLWAAKSPIVLAGGSRWSEAATASLARFAERFAVPVATTFRRTHLMNAEHPSYAGDVGLGINPKLLARIKASDLIVLIGGRLGEIPSQSYSLLDIPGPRQTLVHVHPGAEELGRVYHPHLAIHAAPTGFAAALEGLQPPNEISWRAQTKSAHDDYLAWTETATPQPGGVNLGEIVVWLRQNLPEDCLHHHRRRQFLRLGASLLSFPEIRHAHRADRRLDGLRRASALGLKRAFPERTVVCFSGDGDFLMNGQEFATAVQYEVPFITSSSTTAPTAPSACTRSANIRTAWSAPI